MKKTNARLTVKPVCTENMSLDQTCKRHVSAASCLRKIQKNIYSHSWAAHAVGQKRCDESHSQRRYTQSEKKTFRMETHKTHSQSRTLTASPYTQHRYRSNKMLNKHNVNLFMK